MRIDGSFPNHVARAYGLKLVRPPADAAKVARPQQAQPMQAPAKVMPSSPIAPNSSVQPSAKISQLIAGTVPGPVDFTSGHRAASVSGALPLYTQSADRVEAATAVQIGRQLDVKA